MGLALSAAQPESPLDGHMLPPCLTPYAIRQQQIFAAASLRVDISVHTTCMAGSPDHQCSSQEGMCSGSAKGACAPAAPELHVASLLTGCKEEVLTRERASPE